MSERLDTHGLAHAVRQAIAGRRLREPARERGGASAPAARVRWSRLTRAFGRRRELARILLALAIGIAVLVALRLAGWSAAADDALGQMGFDPDRSRLLSSLAAEAVVIAAAIAVVGRTRFAILPGLAAFAIAYGQTFVHETNVALQSSGPAGTFDPIGWALTLVTLVLTTVLVGLAVVLLVTAARTSVLDAIRRLGDGVRQRSPRGVAASFTVLLVAILVVVLVPTFGDMVNYGPDVRMVQGGQAAVGLAAQPQPIDAIAGQIGGAIVPGLAHRTGIFAGPAAPVPVSSAKPWLAWRPSGPGKVTQITMPAPWVGGAWPIVHLFVYTPPGYDQGNRRYPVVYEAPWGIGGYQIYAHITNQLDSLITSGAIPPELFVFMSSSGGPYPDSECVNSYDGREWFDTYASSTVPAYVDSHFRTIARPAARSLLGFSQGAFCAASLLLRHPDTFSSAMIFSGYFQAGLRTGQTPNAWRVFGGNQQLIAADSPLLLATHVAPTYRNSLFVTISGLPTESFYGPQYRAFVSALHHSGVAVDLFPTGLGHAWTAVRQQLPSVLEALASRQAATRVFA